MGIYNRDYLRDDGSDEAWRGERPTARPPMSMVTKIIIATVIVFVAQLLTSRQVRLGNGESATFSTVEQWLALDPGQLMQGQVWRLLTYAFCHSLNGIFHLLFNMMVLFTFGRVICQLTGEREFLWFYLVAAVFAGIVTFVFGQLVGRPAFVIGASGAVTAAFMLFVMHYPRQKLLVFGIVPVEARWLLAVYLVLDAGPALLEVLGKDPGTQIAHSAHLGGFLFGFLYFRWNMRITRWWDGFAGRMQSRNRDNLKVYNPGTQPRVDHSGRVDEILEKISREGEASLTSAERRILADASRRMRENRQ
ncbi:MAG: rhomboid family intramembrane serine protease [Planctomycetaceae bacterium]|nr:rhomboid family intramembrane serine protease [Planctomycetaceae bacterium]